jgi:hypothetical protein
LLRFSDFCFEVKQSEAKFKSFFSLFSLFFTFFYFFSLFFRFFSLNFRFTSIFSFNFRLFYLHFRFRFLVFHIEVNHVKSGIFFASKRNEIFASISNFASEAKVRAHPSRNIFIEFGTMVPGLDTSSEPLQLLFSTSQEDPADERLQFQAR